MSVCVVVVVLTLTFRCPEVGLDFSLLGVQRSDYNFSLLGFQRLDYNFMCPEVGFEFSLDAPPRKELDPKVGKRVAEEISL